MRSMLLTKSAACKIARALAAIDELCALWSASGRERSEAVNEWLHSQHETLLRTIGTTVVCGRYRW